MGRTNRKKRSSRSGGDSDRPRSPKDSVHSPSLPDRLDAVAFCLIVTLIASRPFLGEILDSAIQFAVSTDSIIGLMGPPESMAINVVFFSSGAIWLIAGALRGRIDIHRNWGWIWICLWLLGAAIGATTAGNLRSALTGVIDLAGGLCIFIVLAHLLDRPWRRRLLVASVLAGASAVGVKCLMQRHVEYGELLEHLNQNPDVASADRSRRGVAMLEARVRAMETTGFFSHPNVCAAYLTLCVPAGIGLAIGKWRSREHQPVRRAIALIGLAALAPAAWGLWLTGSRAGVLCFILAAALIAILALAGEKITRSRRLAIAGVSSLVVLGTLGTILYGVSHGGLPSASMQFRWYYWSAAWESYRQSWATGIGMQQFGPEYLRHKPAESSDEVRDPHNSFLTTLVECGPIGAVGMGGFLVWLFLSISRGTVPPIDENSSRSGEDEPLRAGPLGWAAAAACGVWVVYALALSGSGGGVTSYLIWFSIAFWSVFVASMAVFLLDRNRLDLFAQRDLGWVHLCTACGLIGFLVHNSISYSLYSPGVGSVFFALAAVCVSRTVGAPEDRRVVIPRPKIIATAAVGCCILLATFVWFPTARAGESMKRSMTAGSETTPSILEQLHLAGQWDRLDPTPMMLLARRQATMVATAEAETTKLRLLSDLEETYQEAKRRDRKNLRWDYGLAIARLQRYHITHDAGVLKAARDSYGAAVDGNPTDSRLHKEYGDVLAELADRTGERINRDLALRHYELALETATAIPRETEFPRLTVAQFEEIGRKIDELTRP
jgi:O-antigen ligase